MFQNRYGDLRLEVEEGVIGPWSVADAGYAARVDMITPYPGTHMSEQLQLVAVFNTNACRTGVRSAEG